MVSAVFKTLTGDQLSRLSSGQIKVILTINSPASENKKARDESKTLSFLIDAICLSSLTDSKPIIPIPIDVNLPHMALTIGQSLTGPQFTLSLAYDTCIALCVGYLAFHLAVAEKLPQLVKSLIWAKDEYSPLIVSGIVSDEASEKSLKPTSTLPAVIEYHMPYLTREGDRTSLKISLGKGVSINTNIGMSMIRPAELSLDLMDDVMEPGVLDTIPFPINYKPTIRLMPDFSNLNEVELKSRCSLPATVTANDVVVCRTYIATSMHEAATSKTVTFTLSIKLGSDYIAVCPHTQVCPLLKQKGLAII
jgi:hypothetical protein